MTNAEKLYEMGLDALDNNDEDAAFSLFSQAASEGYAKAQFELGLMYENGQGTDADSHMAGEWYLKAAHQDLPEAQFNYGYMLLSSVEDSAKEEGLSWIRKAAQAGDEAAAEYLSAMETEADKKKRMEAAEKARKAYAAAVVKLDKIFVIISGFTRRPYMGMSKDGKTYTVLCYETKEKAQEMVDRLKERREIASIQEVRKGQIKSFFEELYVYGFNNALFTAESGVYPVNLIEIARRKLPPKNVKIVENPSFQRSMLFYMQEFRRGPEGADQKLRQALDRVMVSHMVGAKFLLPCIESVQNGQKSVQFMIVSLQPNQDKYVPVFTDSREFDRFGAQHKGRMMILDFKQLSEFKLPDGAKGFIINPAGVSAPLPQDYMKKVLEVIKPEKA